MACSSPLSSAPRVRPSSVAGLRRRCGGGRFVVALLVTLGVVGPALAADQKPIRVTTTLTALRSIVSTIGGERVTARAIAAPTYDPHFIEPRPSDIVRLGRSDYFAHMGLDLELWRGPLVEAAVNPRLLPGAVGEIDASAGIELLEVPRGGPSRAGGDIHIYGNPHYWMDPIRVKRIAEQIAGKLASGDPQNTNLFNDNLRRFSEEIDRRMDRWLSELSPFVGSRLVAYHNSWPYFARAFDLRIDLFLEPKPGIPPSGSHLEALVAEMKRQGVHLIIVEPHHPRRTAESVAKRTSGKVLELRQNPTAEESYLDMMESNLRTLQEGLKTAGGGSS